MNDFQASNRADRLESEVASLLRRAEFASAFQPVVSLRDNRVLGYEALLRLPDGSGFPDPASLFAAAAETRLLADLEIAAMETHLAHVARLGEGRLFLNLSAPAFMDDRIEAAALSRRVRRAGIAPERVVLELTELVRLPDPASFASFLTAFRSQGFALAVDDFGSGFTNMRMLMELGPDFVKVDRSLVSGAAEHPRKRVFLESIGLLGRRINCAVIGEGAETPADLATLRACGIPYAQGNGLVRPAALQFFIGGASLPALATPDAGQLEESVGALAVPQEGVSPTCHVERLIVILERKPEPAAVPVLAGTRVAGLVTPGVLFFHLGHRYGFSLWQDRPVSEFVAMTAAGYDRLSASASLDDAAEMVRRRPATRRFDPIVVENERGDYHGLLPVDLLLGEMTRLKVEYALQANPLTRLPGSAALARATAARLAAGRHFALGWADIDHFKPFNDRYGFDRGDQVLLLLAEILASRLGGRADDLLAHPGGDDFAFLTAPAGAESRAREAGEEFSARVLELYDPEDRRAGGISSADRQGVVRSFGFVSLSVGLVVWSGEAGASYRRLVEVAAEVKAVAKRQPGPAVVRNRRSLLP